jgi:hypothetical protein
MVALASKMQMQIESMVFALRGAGHGTALGWADIKDAHLDAR